MKTYNDNHTLNNRLLPTPQKLQYPGVAAWLPPWPARLRGRTVEGARRSLSQDGRQTRAGAPNHEIMELRLWMVMNSSSCGFLATIAWYSSKVM